MKELLGMLLRSYECYTIIYKGQALSWNDFYASSGKNAWKSRKSKIDKYHKIFDILIKEAKLPWFDEYAIVLFYRSKHDADNVLANVKGLQDALKQIERDGIIIQNGYCKDDSRKYCKMVTAIYDKSLEHNEFHFKIIKLK